MIVILGSGYISQAYQIFFKEKEISYTVLSRSFLDYTDYNNLYNFLSQNRPSLLINAAGYTGNPNVDGCENHKEECYLANVELPSNIGKICKDLNISWGHVSSGCIYQGDNNWKYGYSEYCPPNFTFKQENCSYYSGTKALAEEILSFCDNVYIWRIRMPFNNIDHPKNYLSKILKYDKLINVTNSLTNLDDFVRVTYQLVKDKAFFGIYNICNPGRISTSDITEIMSNRWPTKTFSFFESYKEFEKVISAPRSNCVLNPSKLIKLGISLSEVHESVSLSIKNWKV